MLIIVTDSLQTRSVMIEIPESMATDKKDGLAEELQILSNFLGEKLKGYPIDWRSPHYPNQLVELFLH